MMIAAMKGNVPDATPRGVQPIPARRLETMIAMPKAPVSAAVTISSVRRLTTRSAAGEPALLRADLACALQVLLDELLQLRARDELRALLRALDVFLPFRRGRDLLHQVGVVLRLLRLHLAGQPHGTRLL